MAVALDGEIGELRLKREHLVDVFAVEHSSPAAKLPTDQFDRQSTAHDNARRFWIDKDIELRCRRDISFATWLAAQHNAWLDLLGMGGTPRAGGRIIRQGPRVTSSIPGFASM